MHAVTLILLFIHIAAFIIGGANAVVMPIIGARMASAMPDTRGVVFSITGTLAKVGKVAMAVLLLSEVLTLWLKWNWQVPSPIFWVKMAGVAAMIVFISLGHIAFNKAKTGDREAAGRMKLLGQLTTLAFVVVVLSAVFAFN